MYYTARARYYNEYLRPAYMYKHICKARAFSWGVTLSQPTKETRARARNRLGIAPIYVYGGCVAHYQTALHRRERRGGGGGYYLNFNESCGCKCRSYSLGLLHSCICSSIYAAMQLCVYTRAHTCTRARARKRVTRHAFILRPCKILSSFTLHCLYHVYLCRLRGDKCQDSFFFSFSLSLFFCTI